MPLCHVLTQSKHPLRLMGELWGGIGDSKRFFGPRPLHLRGEEPSRDASGGAGNDGRGVRQCKGSVCVWEGWCGRGGGVGLG